MKKVDFSQIEVEMIDGKMAKADLQHGENGLGNQLYMQGRDIRECELGRKIYFAEGEIEITDDEAKIVCEAVKGWSYVARTAIEKMLDT